MLSVVSWVIEDSRGGEAERREAEKRRGEGRGERGEGRGEERSGEERRGEERRVGATAKGERSGRQSQASRRVGVELSRVELS
jgi:hypothetical protein